MEKQKKELSELQVAVLNKGRAAFYFKGLTSRLRGAQYVLPDILTTEELTRLTEIAAELESLYAVVLDSLYSDELRARSKQYKQGKTCICGSCRVTRSYPAPDGTRTITCRKCDNVWRTSL